MTELREVFIIALELRVVRRYRLKTMKKVTVREFCRSADLVDRLAEGKQLVVTANGKSKFVVIKSFRPKMTRKLAETRPVGDADASRFDGTAFLASLKK